MKSRVRGRYNPTLARLDPLDRYAVDLAGDGRQIFGIKSELGPKPTPDVADDNLNLEL